MDRRRRQPFKTIESVDVQIINTKLQLHHSLVSAKVDYDHYRAGDMPNTSLLLSQPWLTLSEKFSDISPCDFIDFKSNILDKYTSNRSDIDPVIPVYYIPHAKEERLFCRYLFTIIPEAIRKAQETGGEPRDLRFLDDLFYLHYETVLSTRHE